MQKKKHNFEYYHSIGNLIINIIQLKAFSRPALHLFNNSFMQRGVFLVVFTQTQQLLILSDMEC